MRFQKETPEYFGSSHLGIQLAFLALFTLSLVIFLGFLVVVFRDVTTLVAYLTFWLLLAAWMVLSFYLWLALRRLEREIANARDFPSIDPNVGGRFAGRDPLPESTDIKPH